jgi:hypothetical protein
VTGGRGFANASGHFGPAFKTNVDGCSQS